MAEYSSDLFRTEALEHHVNQGGQGDVLRISPRWTQWSYWLLIAVCAAGLIYAALGKIYQYASGPAVVRVEGRIDLTAKAAGVVAAVDVKPRQRVHAGQPLVRFDVASEKNELLRIQREFDLLLVRILRDPTDQNARQALTALRAQQELAATRVEQRAVYASHDGLVDDIRIRPGQHLAPGDVVLSLLTAESRFFLVALLPGHSRPLLRSGQSLRVELAGYRYEYRDLRIDTVGDDVVGPAEVRRYLPQNIADAVPVSGPVVLVLANIPSSTFLVDGQPFHYYEGMQGTAEVRVRAESILVTLVPALKVIFPPEWTHAP